MLPQGEGTNLRKFRYKEVRYKEDRLEALAISRAEWRKWKTLRT